jgi:hypothetical protein
VCPEMTNANRDHKFVVKHQRKQQIILRALEEMDTSKETPHETAAVIDMVSRLEDLIGRRQRARAIGEPISPRRKRVTR